MKHNLVIKVLLLAIMVLLTANLIRPLVSPSLTHAAGSIQYKVMPYPPLRTVQAVQLTQSLLDQLGKKGWELVVIEPSDYYFIFKK